MASVRLRGRHEDFLLVPARRVRAVSDPAAARSLARRMLASPELSRTWPGTVGQGDGEPTEDELVRALLDGELVVVEVEPAPRLMDSPRTQSLLELAGPMDWMPEPVRTPSSWVGVRVVDPRGRPLPWFAVRVDDPAGKRHDARLDADAQVRVDGLADDGSCVVTLTAAMDEGR